MVNMHTKFLFWFFVTLFTIIGCEKKAAEEIDFGTWEGYVFYNNYFDMVISIPENWSIQDEETMNQIMNTGAKMIAKDDKNMEAMMNASEMQVVKFVAAFQHPLGTAVPFNPNFMCLAERVKHVPGIKKGEDYLYHGRKLLESGQINVSFPDDVYTESISGIDFDVLHSVMTIRGVDIHQKQYASVMKGYVLLFIVTFSNDEEEALVDDILRGVTLS